MQQRQLVAAPKISLTQGSATHGSRAACGSLALPSGSLELFQKCLKMEKDGGGKYIFCFNMVSVGGQT